MTPMMLGSVFIFVLAIFVGVEIIRKVPQTLHTPLMSGSNAISGVTVLGGLAIFALAVDSTAWWTRAAAFLAIVFAMVNVVGGFLVTDRMLKMFKRR